MANLQEIFVPISGYENYYEVSIYGTVRSKDRIIIFSDGRKRFFPGKTIKQKKTVKGYMIAPVSVNKNGAHLFIHRLIGIHFIPNPENKPFINHIDCNKSNNSIDNLEWCSHLENTVHAVKNNLFKKGGDHFNTNFTENIIREIKNSKDRGCDLAKKFNVCRSTITEIRKGTNWKHVTSLLP